MKGKNEMKTNMQKQNTNIKKYIGKLEKSWRFKNFVWKAFLENVLGIF